MKARALSLFVILVCLLHLQVYTQVRQRPDTSGRAREVLAQQKLGNFKTTLNERNIRNFGFNSMDDLRNASLSSPPFQLVMIPLDQLRNYNGSAVTNSMFIFPAKHIYPVINVTNQRAVNAMVVEYSGTNPKWKIVSMGKSKQMAATVYALYKSNPMPYFIATIPFLNLDFISYRSGNRIMMIPVVSDTQNKLEAGNAVPAERIFATYAAVARRYNGLPM
jgi:hypothetical protein